MLQRDYFLRMIQEFARALANFLEKQHDDEKRDREMAELYRQYVGDYGLLRNLSVSETMTYLRKRDVVDGYIIYRRKKTGQTLMVEMEPEMAAIIARYPTDTPYLLPLISEAGDTGRRQYRNQLMRVNRNLKPIGRMASLPIPLSMYVMRHAWATIARDKGFSLSVISKGLGHDNEATTRIYLNSLRASQIDDANRIILDDLKTSTNKD